MSFALQVFVSSACHELRDLRASIRTWLEDLGMTPVMSDEAGFPRFDGMPPDASCLRALEECPLVVGVVDRFYGTTFDDWGPLSRIQGSFPYTCRIASCVEARKAGPHLRSERHMDLLRDVTKGPVCRFWGFTGDSQSP